MKRENISQAERNKLLTDALQYENVNSMKIAVILGADKPYLQEAFHWAISHGQDTLAALLKEAGVNLEQALLLQIEANQPAGVGRLLDLGADIASHDHAAIRKAIQLGNLAIVKMLLKSGADIAMDNHWLIRYAAYYGHLELVQWLAKHGGDIRAMDDWALGWAVANGHIAVSEYIASISGQSLALPSKKERNQLLQDGICASENTVNMNTIKIAHFLGARLTDDLKETLEAVTLHSIGSSLDSTLPFVKEREYEWFRTMPGGVDLKPFVCDVAVGMGNADLLKEFLADGTSFQEITLEKVLKGIRAMCNHFHSKCAFSEDLSSVETAWERLQQDAKIMLEVAKKATGREYTMEHPIKSGDVFLSIRNDDNLEVDAYLCGPKRTIMKAQFMNLIVPNNA